MMTGLQSLFPIFLLLISTLTHSATSTKYDETTWLSGTGNDDSTTIERRDSGPEPEPQNDWSRGINALIPTVLVLNIKMYKYPGVDVQLNKDKYKEFRDVMCNNSTETADIIIIGPSVQKVMQWPVTRGHFSKFYTCYMENRSHIWCMRLDQSELEDLCDDDGICTPDWYIYDSDCELGQVGLFWDMDQETKVEYIHPWLQGKFSCNRNCPQSNSVSDEDGEDTTASPEVDDGSISAIVIGIIIVCVFLFAIVALAFSIWVYRVMRKGTSLKHLSPGNSTSFEGVDIGRQGGFQKKNSSHNLFGAAAGNGAARRTNSTGTQGYVSFHTGSGNESVESGGDGPETTYAYIDERLMNKTKNYYSVIDDNAQDAAPKPSEHPKNRPPLPLPAHVANQPVPYYSVAQPEEGSANENGDMVSGQYIEIIEDNSNANPSANQDSSSTSNSNPSTEDSVYTKPMEKQSQPESGIHSDGNSSPTQTAFEPEIEGDTVHPLSSYPSNGLDNPNFEDSEISTNVYPKGAVSRIEIKHSPKSKDKESTSHGDESSSKDTELQ